ncbi:hypothetical protein [Blautia sp. MSJ-36]|uniref:hypothetical protein n=1 Tax=Blautia sp. MSJ-36 TaxID=2841530 RepID=UPI001C11B239|nr:hypothetical protein [Blautia sp. MSJ-36]MBU5447383.1 hypothetical protein [Blautia sp. MSJ-36]
MGNSITYKILDGNLTFDSRVLEYGKLKKEFDEYGEELAKVVGDFHEENKSRVMDMYHGEHKYYEYMYRQLNEIVHNIDDHMKKYIQILVNHGVYDKEETQYSHSNSGVVSLLNLTNMEYDLKCLMWDHMNDMYQMQADDAYVNAYSQVQGNQYGIITNSVSASILYGIENEYRIKKSTQRANSEYSSALDSISNSSERWFNNEWGKEFIQYTERLFGLLPSITDALFEQITEDFIKCGIIDKDTHENINREKSDTIIKNLDIASDKKKVLLEAINADPFNEKVYEKIVDEDCLSEDVIKFAIDFGMTEPLLQELSGQLSNIILGGEIDIDRFNLDMKYVNLLSAESEDNIRKKVLGKYLAETEDILKRFQVGITDQIVVQEMYSYLKSNKENLEENISKYFEKLFIFWQLEVMPQILKPKEISDLLNRCALSGSSIGELKEYFVKEYHNAIIRELEKVESYQNEIRLHKSNLEAIEIDIADTQNIITQNKYKLFGEGAKKRKSANEKLQSLLYEKGSIKSKISSLQNYKIASTKDIPFVDEEHNIDEDGYLVNVTSELLRKKEAGFITEEECSKKQSELIDKYTRHQLGGTLDEVKKKYLL